MAKPSIKSLNMMAFTKMTPEREARIAEAPADIPAAPGTYKPNQLAAALHPAVQHLVIKAVVDRGPKFRSFLLAPDAERGTEELAYFDAGQYLSVEIPLPTGSVTRPFSISSSPIEALAGIYELTVERVEGGKANDWLWGNWTVGAKVDASSPQGHFCYEPLRDAPNVVALVGGSSITPIASLAKAVAEGTEPCTLTILYGTNTMADAVLQDELTELCAACDKVRLVNVLANETREGCEHGFITPDMVRARQPEGPCSYFICGPQPMQRAVDGWIDELGVRPKFVRREVFGEYRNPERDDEWKALGIMEGATFKLTVRMAGVERTVDCSSHDTLLNAMEQAGIHAPARCRSGECGWCHSRLISGDVHIPKRTDGRRAADRKFGYIHPCATFAASDVSIEVPPFAN